jgi:hypothetical protein
VTLPVVSAARHSEADAQETLVSLSASWCSLTQVAPLFSETKTLPAASTAAQTELPEQLTAVSSLLPSISALEADALPLLARVSDRPAFALGWERKALDQPELQYGTGRAPAIRPCKTRAASRSATRSREAFGLGARQDADRGDLTVDDFPTPRGRELSSYAVALSEYRAGDQHLPRTRTQKGLRP